MIPNIFGTISRRAVAFLIDLIILVMIGLILGFVFFWKFASLGPKGIILGYVIAALYFITLHSIFGQTIGKAILNLKVIGKNGEKILPAYACLRFIFLAIPFALINIDLQEALDAPSYSEIIVKTAALALPLIIIYLLIFNLRTGQTLHDYLSASYVIHTDGYEIEETSYIWPAHFIICALIAASCLGYTIYDEQKKRTPEFKELRQAELHIRQELGIQKVHISQNPQAKNVEEKSWIIADISLFRGRLRSTPSTKNIKNPEQLLSPILSAIMNNITNANYRDEIIINLKFGYDIGIARYWKTLSFKKEPIFFPNRGTPWVRFK